MIDKVSVKLEYWDSHLCVRSHIVLQAYKNDLPIRNISIVIVNGTSSLSTVPKCLTLLIVVIIM